MGNITTIEKEVLIKKLSSALLSEKSLAKAWLSKKEEQAWKHLSKTAFSNFF